jgi:hypothetical protein
MWVSSLLPWLCPVPLYATSYTTRLKTLQVSDMANIQFACVVLNTPEEDRKHDRSAHASQQCLTLFSQPRSRARRRKSLQRSTPAVRHWHLGIVSRSFTAWLVQDPGSRPSPQL